VGYLRVARLEDKAVQPTSHIAGHPSSIWSIMVHCVRFNVVLLSSSWSAVRARAGRRRTTFADSGEPSDVVGFILLQGFVGVFLNFS